jgi:hypothetical protein
LDTSLQRIDIEACLLRLLRLFPAVSYATWRSRGGKDLLAMDPECLVLGNLGIFFQKKIEGTIREGLKLVEQGPPRTTTKPTVPSLYLLIPSGSVLAMFLFFLE